MNKYAEAAKAIREERDLTVREWLTRDQSQLPQEERDAIAHLWLDIASGRVHPATSHLDITPAELVVERRAVA